MKKLLNAGKYLYPRLLILDGNGQRTYIWQSIEKVHNLETKRKKIRKKRYNPELTR